jgi:hypothetical protein
MPAAIDKIRAARAVVDYHLMSLFEAELKQRNSDMGKAARDAAMQHARIAEIEKQLANLRGKA